MDPTKTNIWRGGLSVLLEPDGADGAAAAVAKDTGAREDAAPQSQAAAERLPDLSQLDPSASGDEAQAQENTAVQAKILHIRDSTRLMPGNKRKLPTHPAWMTETRVSPIEQMLPKWQELVADLTPAETVSVNAHEAASDVGHAGMASQSQAKPEARVFDVSQVPIHARKKKTAWFKKRVVVYPLLMLGTFTAVSGVMVAMTIMGEKSQRRAVAVAAASERKSASAAAAPAPAAPVPETDAKGKTAAKNAPSKPAEPIAAATPVPEAKPRAVPSAADTKPSDKSQAGKSSDKSQAGLPQIERNAIDALIAGDYEAARQHYERLARTNPQAPAFSVAAQVLALRAQERPHGGNQR